MTHADMITVIALQEHFRQAGRPEAALALKSLLRSAQEGDNLAAGYLELCRLCYDAGRSAGGSVSAPSAPDRQG